MENSACLQVLEGTNFKENGFEILKDFIHAILSVQEITDKSTKMSNRIEFMEFHGD